MVLADGLGVVTQADLGANRFGGSSGLVNPEGRASGHLGVSAGSDGRSTPAIELGWDFGCST